MNPKDEYIRSKQAELDKWNYDIDTMGAKADKVSGDAMQDYHRQIELLNDMQSTGREKIKKLQESADNDWEGMKPDIELTWAEMGTLLESAKHHFR